MRDLNPRCLRWKHQEVAVEIQGSWLTTKLLTSQITKLRTKSLKEKEQTGVIYIFGWKDQSAPSHRFYLDFLRNSFSYAAIMLL